MPFQPPYMYNLDFSIRGVPCQVIQINPDVILFGPQSTYYTVHRHPTWELHYIARGERTVSVEQQLYRADAGQLLLIPPNAFHYCHYSDAPASHMAASFRVSPPESVGSEPGARHFYSVFSLRTPRLLDVPPDGSLAAALEQLFSLARRNSTDFVSVERLRCLSSLMLLALFEALMQQDADQPHPVRIAPTPQDFLIEEFFSVFYNLNNGEPKLAKLLNVSTRQLNRILLENCGMNYREKRKEKRMAVAADLLSNTDHSIEKIAGLLGYNSASAFVTAIRSATGKTPTQLRRELRLHSSGAANPQP